MHLLGTGRGYIGYCAPLLGTGRHIPRGVREVLGCPGGLREGLREAVWDCSEGLREAVRSSPFLSLMLNFNSDVSQERTVLRLMTVLTFLDSFDRKRPVFSLF